MTLKQELKENNTLLLIDIISQVVILPGENHKKLNEIKENVVTDLSPSGSIETLLCSKIVADIWKLRRLYEFEKKILLEQQQSSAISHSYSSDRNIGGYTKRFRSTAKQLRYSEGQELVQKDQTRLNASLMSTIAELKSIQKLRSKSK